MSHGIEESVHLRKYLTGIVGNAPFGIVTMSANNEVGIINDNAIHLLGFKSLNPEDLVDCSYEEVFFHIPRLLNGFNDLLTKKKKRELDLIRIKVNQFTVNIKIRELFNGTLLIIEDITKQAELEDKLMHQATFDGLTELFNRQEFEDRTQKEIKKAQVHHLPGAVIFIDLDRFKPVNDTAGHAAGDELLKRVAGMLQNHIRNRDMLARIGGDEFAILLADCPLNVAEKIADAMRIEIDEFVFIYDDNAFSIGISAGIASFGEENDTLSSVINAADNACQIAKQGGRNSVHTAALNDHEYEVYQQQIAWLPRINTALEKDEFVLFGQEIRSLTSPLQGVHFELLIRLQEGDSIVPPNAFLPAAERYDLMPKIDCWVLDKAFSTLQANTAYSINLSGQSVSDPALAEYIMSLQEKYAIDATKITLEITETAAIQNIEAFISFIKKLNQRGFKFSLDDFGSGLSSFSYLATLPVDYLKIDGSFVKKIATDPISYAMVQSMNEVAHIMGLETIAEFVEDENILNKLIEIGVDFAQGYYLHKPQPLSAL